MDNADNTFQAVVAGTASTDGYGTYAATAGGAWTYTLNNGQCRRAGANAGGTLTDHITALAADGTAQVVAITIHGTNDAAVITGDVTGDVTEAGGVANGTPGTPTATGTADRHRRGQRRQHLPGGGGRHGQHDGYGTYAATAGGVWTYTLNNGNADVQGLNAAAAR